MYNSDYEIRLATLAALGGDTSITYDSVYSIDLEILRLTEQGGGGGEGLNWNQIKNLLASSGVSEIIVNGNDSSITIDYDLLSQIGQGGGGGDYICVDSVDALSGITSPKDGAIAYVAGKGMWKYNAATGITKWLGYDVDFDSLTQEEKNTIFSDYSAYTQELFFQSTVDTGAGNAKFRAKISYAKGSRIYYASYILNFEDGSLRNVKGYLQKNGENNWIVTVKSLKTVFYDGDGSCFNYTKQRLSNNGVTGIKFTSGSTSAITLDYDLVSQIGQGGGGDQDYICVNTIDELSGVTNPVDGMLAYVGAHGVQEEAVVLSVDYYNDGGDWCRFIANYSGTTAKVQFHENGRNINVESGHFLRNNDGWFWDVPSNRSELPADFVYNNGVEGALVSNTDGAEISEHNEYANTVMFYQYNGVLPTLTLDPEDVNNVVFVSSSVTTETVTRQIKEKGFYKFYADVNKWIATEIYIDNYDNTEIQDVLDDYLDYRKPLTAWFMRDYNGKAYRKGFAGSTISNEETPRIRFTTPADDNDSGWMLYSIRYQKESGTWSRTEDGVLSIPNNDEINQRIASKITTTSSQFGLNIGGLFSVGLDETMSGVTISTTINLDASATDENHIATITDKSSGRGYWEQLCEDGWLNGVTTAATNAEWFVIDYNNFWDGDVNSMVSPFAAVKVQDNGDSTFTITYFLSGNNWNGESWSEQRGETNYYQFEADGERGYTWTVTENQTLTVTPHLYTMVRYVHKNNTNNSLMYKLV